MRSQLIRTRRPVAPPISPMIVVATGVAPVLMVSGFAFIAAAPVLISTIGIARRHGYRVLTLVTIAWAAVYYLAFGIYLLQDAHPSKSKMCPLSVHIVMALPGLAIAVRLLRHLR